MKRAEERREGVAGVRGNQAGDEREGGARLCGEPHPVTFVTLMSHS